MHELEQEYEKLSLEINKLRTQIRLMPDPSEEKSQLLKMLIPLQSQLISVLEDLHDYYDWYC